MDSVQASRDYNIGEGAETSAVAAALDMGSAVPEEFVARKFDYEGDTVAFDLILVMDKFTAADVMREISVFDTINKHGNYTQKVRRLGEFHPQLRLETDVDGQDIDDPLYGNEGGALEEEAVRRTARLIWESCEGVLMFLEDLQARHKNERLSSALKQEINSLEQLDWLVPPMLQRR